VRFSAPLLTVVGTVAGAAAAVVTYQSAAAPASTVTRTVADSTASPAPAAPSWLPCEHGWKVHGTSCVRVKHRVVVVHDLPAPAAAAAAATAGVTPPVAVARDSRGGGGKAQHSEAADEPGETTDGSADDAAGETDHDAPGTEDVGGDD